MKRLPVGDRVDMTLHGILAKRTSVTLAQASSKQHCHAMSGLHSLPLGQEQGHLPNLAAAT